MDAHAHAQRILIVDDTPSSRSLLEATLAQHYDVLAVGTYRAAMAALGSGSGSFALILTDIVLGPDPSQSGIALARSLPPGHPPIIAISGILSQRDMEPHIPLDLFVDVLPKPLLPRDLLAAVRAALGCYARADFCA